MQIPLLPSFPCHFHFFLKGHEPDSFSGEDLVLRIPPGINDAYELLEFYRTGLHSEEPNVSGWNMFKWFFDFEAMKKRNVQIIHVDVPLLHDPYDHWSREEYLKALFDRTEFYHYNPIHKIETYFPKECEGEVLPIVCEYIAQINVGRRMKNELPED